MYSIFTHIWEILGQMLVNIPAPWILWLVEIFLGDFQSDEIPWEFYEISWRFMWKNK